MLVLPQPRRSGCPLITGGSTGHKLFLGDTGTLWRSRALSYKIYHQDVMQNIRQGITKSGVQ